MLRFVALVRTDVSEERIASIKVARIYELLTTLSVTSNRRTLRRNTTVLFALMMEALPSSETSVLTGATRRNIQKTAFFRIPMLGNA
jgi:hypothetical protein